MQFELFAEIDEVLEATRVALNAFAEHEEALRLARLRKPVHSSLYFLETWRTAKDAA